MSKQTNLDKVLLLEKDMQTLIVPLYTEEEVIRHFREDTYRAFKYFARPELIQEDRWKERWGDWKETILDIRKRYEYLLIFPFDPATIDRGDLMTIVIDANKEART